MKLQNAPHTTQGNCMPKLTVASLVCINLSCREAPAMAQLGCQHADPQHAASRSADSCCWVLCAPNASATMLFWI